MKAEVTVERNWKGALSDRVSVLTEGTSAVEFEKGQRYRMYLKSVSAQDYAADRCSGTARLGGVTASAALAEPLGSGDRRRNTGILKFGRPEVAFIARIAPRERSDTGLALIVKR